MNVIHELRGYDRTTDLIAEEYSIPGGLLPIVRTMIQPEPGDRDLILAYHLVPENAVRLALLLGVPVDANTCNFCVEASAADDVRGAAETVETVAVSR